jgi:tRNA(Ile)-lysidine synthase
MASGRSLRPAIIAVCEPLAMGGRSVVDAVRAAGALSPTDRVVALVSGGRDSICLIDVLTSICGAARVTALHVNYGLRAQESDGDERHVREVCEFLGVRCVCVAAPPAPVRGNLQAWARDVRYARALELSPSALIATGHTASDQAETVLYRLAASPGRRALLGMAPREGRLVRPLLRLTREQTAAHCVDRGLRWRDDSTNDSSRFARGRVRHGVLPALRAVHPAAEQNLLRSVEILQAESAVLDGVVEVALAGRRRIALTRLEELPAALARLVVIRLAEDAAGEPVAGVGGRLAELVALAGRGGSASLDVGAGTRAVVEYGVLRFTREAPAAAVPGAESLSVPGTVAFGSWSLRATLERAGATALADAGGEVGLLDADRMGSGPLTVRAWRAGDRMRPLGLGGSKTLADLFTDRRIPRAQRSSLPIVLSAGEIAWIPRVATAEPFRVRADTRRLAVLRAVPAGAGAGEPGPPLH